MLLHDIGKANMRTTDDDGVIILKDMDGGERNREKDSSTTEV